MPLFRTIRILWAARQLRRGVPVAKIIGRKWFYGMEFETNRHTLDPRPDSETLVEAVLDYVGAKNIPPLRILDLGTGTGCLICAIAKNIPNATGVGIDISRGAVRVARRNVARLGLTDRIKITRGDFNKISNLKSQISNDFDIIISNPPYIARGDARVDAGARHDPACALYAGADGLDAYRAIARGARRLLTPGGRSRHPTHREQSSRRGPGRGNDKSAGRIFLEIGAGQGDSVREIFAAAGKSRQSAGKGGWRFVRSHDDLSGIERVLIFK